jgi:hypothetical protein
MSLTGSIFSKVAGMASTLGVGSRAALLPGASRSAPKAARSLNTSAARAQEGNMEVRLFRHSCHDSAAAS